MINYRICYEAKNLYDHQVHEALFEFLVLPCADHTQDVTEEKVENSLRIPVFRSRNASGYQIISLRIAQPFDQFTFKIDCTVRKKTGEVYGASKDILPLQEELHILQSQDFTVDYYLYIQQTPLTVLPSERVLASLLFQKDKSLFYYISELNQAVYTMMEYKAGVTTLNTRASEVLDRPQGVCQDYAHLMLGILRHQQIPCRYVSGYLNQGQEFMGAAQMHAWVEACIPGMGWIGFDPTNNRMADEHHIKVADGTDYNDCSPLKGHIRPAGPNSTNHTVEVVEQQAVAQQ